MAINYTSISDFTEQLRIVISKEEGLCEQPKDVGDHTVTYGYGYTLIRKDGNGHWRPYDNLVEDLAQIGIALNQGQIDTLDAIARSLNNGEGATPAHAQLITDFATSLGKPDLTTTDAQTLFNAEWAHQRDLMESKLESLLGATTGSTVFQNLENTREMVALASLFYNSPALLGSGLAGALRDGNRAEAWYEIRYNSNKLGWAQINGNATGAQQADINQNIDKGLAKRRFYEAELFSFYNTGDATSDLAEATQAYKMFTTHRAMILQYEATYGNLNGQAGSRGDQIGEANSIGGYNLIGSPYEVNTLSDELKPAADVLIAEYVKSEYGFPAADPFNPLNIQVASDNAFILTGEDTSDRTGSDADLLIGRDSGSDLLSGGGGNDLLIGGDGNDFLIGGLGEDVLVGGKGFDTYIWNPGDGNDRIIEEREDGQIRGVIKDQAGNIISKGIWEETAPGTGLYENIETGAQATKNSPFTLQLDGEQVILEDFESGDFGMTLLDNTAPAQVIVPPGDANANYLSDQNNPNYPNEAGRDVRGGGGRDMIAGAYGDDFLFGGDGDDWINGVGGADRIEGGAGNDYITWIGGGSVAKGGDGDDIITASAREQFYIDFPASPFTKDVIWADMSGHWQAWHTDNFSLDDNGYLSLSFSGGVSYGTYTGASVMGGGWTYEFKISTNNIFEIKYFHPTEAPSGMRPAFDWAHGMMSEPLADKGVVLLGEGGNDVLIGHNQADYLSGGTEHDILTGNGGSDTLDGGAGDDDLAGGDGDDILLGGEGTDQLFGEAGSDMLYGEAGNDFIWADSQSSQLAAQDGDDYAEGGAGDDQIVGQGGNDTLWGGEGNDILNGGTGNDTLLGGEGNDTLSAGTGNDIMDGGEGDDTYHISRGDGIKHLRDSGGNDRLVLDGIANAGSIYLRLFNGSLMIGDSDSGDEFYFDGVDLNDLAGTLPVDGIKFSNGQTLSMPEIVDMLGIEIEAAPDEQTITGTSSRDFIMGSGNGNIIDAGAGDDLISLGGGNNTVFAGDGDDVIASGDGNDVLTGGLGDDRYLFNLGNGKDVIDDYDKESGSDALMFGYEIGGADPEAVIIDTDVQAFKEGNNLVLKVRDTDDQVSVTDYYAENTFVNGNAFDHKINKVEFGNGVVWDQAMIQTMVDRSANNQAPVVNSPLPALKACDGFTFTYVIPEDTIIDPDSWDFVTYSVRMAGGSELPEWLSFDAETLTLSGTPSVNDIGSLQVELWGTDSYNLSVSEIVTLNVGINESPVIENALQDQIAPLDGPFFYSVPETVFNDPDTGDQLSYTATLADGNALPSWLNFNPDTRMFSGTPHDMETFSVRITATDRGNLSVSDTFELSVEVQDMIINGTPGNDILDGSAGNDTLNGYEGHDTLNGGIGNDILNGGADNDTLNGGDGNDTLDGGDRSDILNGGAGSDIMIGGMGNDIYYADNVNDTGIELENEGRDKVESSASYVLATNVEDLNLIGTDNLNGTGNELDNCITGNQGANTLVGGDGNDLLDGGEGDDTLFGGEGNDTLISGTGYDVLYGGKGYDTYLFSWDGSTDTDIIVEEQDDDGSIHGVIRDGDRHIISKGLWQETGTDTGIYINAETGIQAIMDSSLTIQLDGGQVVIEDFKSGDFGMTLVDHKDPDQAIVVQGNDTANVLDDNSTPPFDKTRDIRGSGGKDKITGDIGDDFLSGGDGDDWIAGAGGADQVDGGAGNDFISWIGGGTVAAGGEGNDIITASVRQQLIIDIPYSPLTRDVIWADLSQHWQPSYGDGLYLDENGYLADWFTSGLIINEVFSGASTMGGGWTYRFTTGGDGGIELKYFHPTEAPGGMDAAWDLHYGMMPEPDAEKGVVLMGEGGNDLLIGHNQADSLFGGTERDILMGNGGNDILDGGAGDDDLAGGQGNDIEFGGDGNDQIFGESGSDILYGESGDDILFGGDGDDLLSGGEGNDILNGGAGDDTYVYTFGHGIEIIRNNDAAGTDTISFGLGIEFKNVHRMINGNDLFFIINDSNSQRIVFENWIDGEQNQVDYFRFCDGILKTWAEMLEPKPVSIEGSTWNDIIYGDGDADNTITGDNGNDFLTGGVGNDTLYGDAGRDLLESHGGDDTLNGGDDNDNLIGGVGNDALVGGLGDDTYQYYLGDGQDSINDYDKAGGLDCLYFDYDDEIFDTDVLTIRDNNDLLFKLKNSDGGLRIIDYYAENISVLGGETFDHKINMVEFSNGVVWDQAMIQTMADQAANNNAPTVNSQLPTLEARAGEIFTFVVPENTIADPDPLDSITYTVKMEDGSELPEWLFFDAQTRTLTGTPDADDVGSLQFVLWGTDEYNHSISESVTLNVEPLNQAPILETALPDQAVALDGLFSYSIPDSAFTDPDEGDVLSYSATLADGTALPSWLNFDATTKTFSGTPSDLGTLSVRVIATDTRGLSVSDIFNLSVSVQNLTIKGTPGHDIFNGGAGDDLFLIEGTDTAFDTFNGGDGFDTVLGSDRDDTIRLHNFSGANTVEMVDGGAGFNTIAGNDSGNLIDLSGTTLVNIAQIDSGLGNDTVIGSVGNDIIIGGAGLDNLQGGAGDDLFLIEGTDTAFGTFNGGTGFDKVLGGDGDDVIRLHNFSGNNTVEMIDGGTGTNIIAGNDYGNLIDLSNTTLANIAQIETDIGNDTVIGSVGNDTIIGGAGTDNLQGGSGDDLFLIEGTDAAFDTFNGGTGFDKVLGGDGDDVIRLHNFSGNNTVEMIDGGTGTNIIAGNDYGNLIDLSNTTLVNIAQIDSGLGNDTVTGSAGNDTIIGGAGTDNLQGGSGDDLFLIEGIDTAYDTFNGGDGFDRILGSDGDDIIRLHNFSNANTVEMIDGRAGFNTIAGNDYGNLIDLSGTTLMNITQIESGLGNDTVIGSVCNDIIIGGAGLDNLQGGSGDDLFLIEGMDTAYDSFNGGTGFDKVLGGDGDDVIRLHNYSNDNTVEMIDGGAGFNTIAGNDYGNLIDMSGTTLVNIAQIDSGLGNDTVIGSVCNDIIIGGAGLDNLQGRAGDDTYVFNMGDGADIVNNNDCTGFDIVSFGLGIGQAVGLFRNGNTLEIGYSDTDKVSISSFFSGANYQVDQVKLSDDSFITAADINQIIQDMAAYAVSEGIALTSVNDVRNNDYLVTMIANSWHA